MSKKQRRLEANFHGFRNILELENRWKIDSGGGRWKSRKTLFFLSKINDFQPRALPKIMNFASRNANAKRKALKFEISSIFGSFWLPKSTRKAMRNGACFATLWKSPGTRRKLASRGAFGLSIWLLI